MRKCPKCSRKYEDSSRICRTCGSFLESITESSEERSDPVAPLGAEESLPVVTPEADEPEEIQEASEGPAGTDVRQAPWPCPQCHELVPGTFDVCWSCGTSRDGTRDPNFVAEPVDLADDVPEGESMGEETVRRGLQCPRCGSSKIIPGAALCDRGGVFDEVDVVIYGKPDALLFKDRQYGRLRADICGACGHVELRVSNPQELYRHYRQANDI
jgi:hypothetical protein